jgi:hypothetical protein
VEHQSLEHQILWDMYPSLDLLPPNLLSSMTPTFSSESGIIILVFCLTILLAEVPFLDMFAFPGVFPGVFYLSRLSNEFSRILEWLEKLESDFLLLTSTNSSSNAIFCKYLISFYLNSLSLV